MNIEKLGKAIGLVKSQGFKIKPVNINVSTDVWDISDDGKSLIQPLSGIKNVGDVAVQQIIEHRPFKKIEDILFNENTKKVNKRALSSLIKCGAFDEMIDADDRFVHKKHFLAATTEPKPTSLKKFKEQIEMYKTLEPYTDEEIIEMLTEISGIFPLELIAPDDLQQALKEKYIPPISEYDPDLEFVWFVPREVVVRQTKNKKDYYIVNVVDNNFIETQIKCWGIRKDKDKIHTARPYMARVSWDPNWGFSMRALYKNLVLLG